MCRCTGYVVAPEVMVEQLTECRIGPGYVRILGNGHCVIEHKCAA